MKLVLGCYDQKPHSFHYRWIDDSWVLSDINPRHQSIRAVDARSLPEGVEAIYASHIVEHIEPEELEKMFKHWYDVLPIGGYAIINVPDLLWALEELKRVEGGAKPTSWYFKTPRKLLEIVYGNVGDTGFDKHRWGFTEKTLREYLENAGFKVEIERAYEAHDMGCLIATATK